MPTLYLVPSLEASQYYKSGPLSTDDAGFDLFVPQTTVFAPGERKMVNMGVKAAMVSSDEDHENEHGHGHEHAYSNGCRTTDPFHSHDDYHGETGTTGSITFQNFWMLPRSSISNTGLMMTNSVGVIDKSYRGDLIASLWNTTSETVTVTKGQRLVQIVARDMGDITRCLLIKCLPESGRGEGGFGSSGR